MQTSKYLGKIAAGAKREFRQSLPGAYKVLTRFQKGLLPAKAAKILASDQPPKTCAEDTFDFLQNSYTQWREEYGYDAFSNWRKAAERTVIIMQAAEGLRQPGKELLEIGCGDGMAAFAFRAYGHQVATADLEDWREERAQSLPFVAANICAGLPFDSGKFDLIYSYNCFEHFEYPRAALDEMVRVCKPGGYVYADFAPLYASPQGLHANSFHMPYPQYLFSESLVIKKLAQLGNYDLARDMDGLQYLNEWNIAQFRALFARPDCELIHFKERTDFEHLSVIANYPQAFSGRGLTLEDATVRGLAALLRKKG